VVRFDERFGGPLLDPTIWMPSYLPAWSSRSAAAATYEVGPAGLRLSIPPEQPLWCPDLHDDPPLRVSAVQSGNWSGPVGSFRGQQPFRDGLVVRQAQDELRGFTPLYGRIEVECRARIGPGSMFAAWMVGMEDEPDRCGEICLVEVFGDGLEAGSAAVGSGIHPFRDPALVEEFSVERQPIDVTQRHTYAIDWRPGGVDFFLDGELARSSTQSPSYPMMLILGLFDFPRQSHSNTIAELAVTRVLGA
jgi:Glycosyl hydrolases family 16